MVFHVPPGIAGVLFDLDDTLSDYASTRDAAVVEWTSGMSGWELAPRETAERWEQLEVTWFGRYTRGELDLTEQRAQRVREFLPGARDWPYDRAIAAFDELRAIYESSWRPFPDAKDALERAVDSGRHVGVLTNGETDYQSRKLESLGLADPRVRLFATGDLPAHKPDPRAFLAACQGLGVPPSETLMIGDNPVTDVAGGVAAGLVVVQLCRNGQEPVAPYHTASLAEVEF